MQNWSITQERQKRASQRQHQAAGREAREETFDLDFGGAQPVVLGAEFPITALAPLRAIDEEMAFLLKQALDLAIARGDRDSTDEQRDGLQLVVNLLVMNPNLPTQTVDIALAVGAELFGEQGMADLAAAKPTVQDVASLVWAVAEWYGAALGEAFRSSQSSTDAGGTSNPTSPDSTTDSTPAEPSSPQAIPA